MIKAQINAIGNVGKIKSEFTDGGTQYTKFSLAVNFGKKDNPETDWYNCTAWGKVAELMYEMVEVGTRVLVSGELRIKKWEKDGKSGINSEINVRDFDILAKGKDKSETPYDE